MLSRNASLSAMLLLVAVCVANVVIGQPEPATEQPQFATGTVFHDTNANGQLDSGEPPLADIRVSNGKDIVRTDEQGRYRLPVTDDTIVFVIKPGGWQTRYDEFHRPLFYYIHKPAGSPDLKYPGVDPTGPLPESINFALTPSEEPEKFSAVLFGDPQPRDQKEVDYITHDVVEAVIGTDASFGVTLGDITFDDLSLFEPLSRSIALIGIPWYNVIGNHDINYDAGHDRHSDETFERSFGPSYYSFDYGQVHFLVLDDVEWVVNEQGKGRYHGGLGPEQMEFIRQDLALIPEDQLVVLMMHIPLVNVDNRQELYRLIENRPFCLSISAHKHVHEHRYITKEDGWRGPEPHHHIINVTACGSWWRGAPDERGIPHATMNDGAPNGWSILSFDGTDYKLDFHAAGRPADYQMQIHAPEVIAAGKAAETQVSVNVFNGSVYTKVELRAGAQHDWQPMEHASVTDPAYLATWKAERALPKVDWITLPDPRLSTHIWQATLPADLEPGIQLIEVRATSRAGQVWTGQRAIRITEQAAAE